MPKHEHILSAASNLLGIALVIIAGLNVSGRSAGSFADEIGWAAAMCFALSSLFSYVALRSERRTRRFEALADWVFLAGLVAIVASVARLAYENA